MVSHIYVSFLFLLSWGGGFLEDNTAQTLDKGHKTQKTKSIRTMGNVEKKGVIVLWASEPVNQLSARG